MLIDTHTHLNFNAFQADVDQVIVRAKTAGVQQMVVVGTNLKNSQRAVALAEQHDGVWAAVGWHPHHVWALLEEGELEVEEAQAALSQLATHPRVVAIGETGFDRHAYPQTHYSDYRVDDTFLDMQDRFFKWQWQLAVELGKPLILHNRQAVSDLLAGVEACLQECSRPLSLVFHCCEPDERLLDFAKQHRVFVGVDGDVTYDQTKQAFIRKVPRELLVLETDAPFFKPVLEEELLTNGRSEPSDLVSIANCVAALQEVPVVELASQTTQNAQQLFGW